MALGSAVETPTRNAVADDEVEKIGGEVLCDFLERGDHMLAGAELAKAWIGFDSPVVAAGEEFAFIVGRVSVAADEQHGLEPAVGLVEREDDFLEYTSIAPALCCQLPMSCYMRREGVIRLTLFARFVVMSYGSLLCQMRPDTIAFISTYEHPSRDSIEATVRQAFPELGLDVIFIKDVVKENLRWLPLNMGYVATEYGARLVRRDATLRDSYFQTSYLLRRIHESMRSRIDRERHVFSFQTQSLYDTSVPGMPHFLYTDHTHLSNLESVFFDKRRLRAPRWRALERKIYENATRVFTRSHNVRNDLLKHYGIPPAKVQCVYAGANVNIAHAAVPMNEGYANQRILFVGGDWERKGGPDLVAAFREALRVAPRAHLVIAGARPGLDLPNCTELGQVPLAELSAQFAQASIFCLPTRLEPFGISVLEAMLHRLPVIGSSEGALPDMIEDGVTGSLFPPGDIAQLTRALIDLLQNPARCREFGEAGYRLASSRYTWSAVAVRLRAEILSAVAAP